MFIPPFPPFDPPTLSHYLIHYVSNGKTLCGIETSDLRKNERWVEPRAPDEGLCNCSECRTAKAGAKP